MRGLTWFGVFIGFAIVIPTSFSQGISLEASDKVDLQKAEKERFTVEADTLMGAVVLDTVTGLEYARCLVGQTYDGNATDENRKCSGNPQELTYSEALFIQKKAGGGWRLPSKTEFQSIVGRSEYKSPLFRTAPPYRGSFGIYREVHEGYWTNEECTDAQYSRVTYGFIDSTFNLKVKDWEGRAYCSTPSSRFAVRLVRKGSRK